MNNYRRKKDQDAPLEVAFDMLLTCSKEAAVAQKKNVITKSQLDKRGQTVMAARSAAYAEVQSTNEPHLKENHNVSGSGSQRQCQPQNASVFVCQFFPISLYVL